jgi:hypothetical protein
MRCFLQHSCLTSAKVSILQLPWNLLLTPLLLVITLLRVFTSEDSTQGYYLLFKRVFTLIQKITQQPVHFDSIHGSGIYGIIVDMDSKQYTGKCVQLVPKGLLTTC